MPLRLLLFIAVVAALLIACGGDDEIPPSDAPATPHTEQSAAPALQEETGSAEAQARPEQAQHPEPERRSEQPVRQDPDNLETADPPQSAQTESQPARPGGPPEPEFDIEIALAHLEHLAGVLGPRASGTEQERAAAQYLAAVFLDLGYETEIQDFAFTSLQTVSRIDTADGQSMLAFRFPGSADIAVTAELVDVPGSGETADFTSVDVRGKVAIVDRGLIEFRVKAVNAEAAGAVALIIVNRQQMQSLGGTLGGDISEIPVLHVQKEWGDELRRRVDTTVSIPEAQQTSGVSQNVIARAPGSRCRVVVGGHYDTVPGVDGANDNASGTALTLAFAETWSDHPGVADICFIGFGAEELGLHGSAAYVRQLDQRGELADVTAMLNLDAIGDGRAPYHIIASPEVRKLGNAVAAALQINAAAGGLPALLGSDHANFARARIPVVFAFPPGGILHTPSDNLDNFDRELFTDIAALNHGILACLLERAGSAISPSIPCRDESP